MGQIQALQLEKIGLSNLAYISWKTWANIIEIGFLTCYEQWDKSHHVNEISQGLKLPIEQYPNEFFKFSIKRCSVLCTIFYNVVNEHLADDHVFKPFSSMND